MKERHTEVQCRPNVMMFHICMFRRDMLVSMNIACLINYCKNSRKVTKKLFSGVLFPQYIKTGEVIQLDSILSIYITKTGNPRIVIFNVLRLKHLKLAPWSTSLF